MTIKINDQEINLKYSFRSLIVYEDIMGETLTVPQTLKEILVLFYSVVLSSANGTMQDLTWDKFIDYLDDNPDKTVEFSNWLKDVLETQNKITEKQANSAEKKSKRKNLTQSKTS